VHDQHHGEATSLTFQQIFEEMTMYCGAHSSEVWGLGSVDAALALRLPLVCSGCRGKPQREYGLTPPLRCNSAAAGVAALGVGPGDVCALFSENSRRWLVADGGLMMLGVAPAVS